MSSSMKKTGRNDPCPCGSGRKFKACCFAVEAKFQARAKPDLSEWSRRARAAANHGDFTDAEFWFRRLAAERPEDAEVLAGLGQSLCWLRKRREGLGYLGQAAVRLEKTARKQRDPRPLLELAGQLQHWGEYATALRLAQLAVRIAPADALAWHQVAVCASRINRLDTALPAARRAVELLPQEPRCHILLAWLDQRQGRLDAARIRLQEVVATCREPEQSARAWLELGTVLDRQQACDDAFTAFARAAELQRGLPQYQALDSERIFRAIAANRAGFDAALLSRWPAEVLGADGLPVPVFLFGFLRSGTTLAGRILDSHPAITVADESPLIHELTLESVRLSGVSGDVAGALRRLDLAGIQALRRYYWRRVGEEYGEEAVRGCFVDKNALNTIEAGLIATVFPEAKILFARRDPRDVCLSCHMQAFAPAPATVNLLSLPGIVRQYTAVMDYWFDLRESLPGGYFDLGYEDGIERFEDTYSRLCEYLGVEWHPGLAQDFVNAGERYVSTPSFAAVSQPIHRGALARWVRYRKPLEPVLPALSRCISLLGYA